MPHSRLHALSFSPCGLYILLRNETGYFKINPQSGLDNDRKLTSGWSFQKLGLDTLELGAIHNVPRKELSHHRFPGFLASWHSLESSKKRGGIHVFCFIFIKEIQPWQDRFRGLYLNVSQQREERPFSLKLFKLNQYSGLGGSSPTRIESH